MSAALVEALSLRLATLGWRLAVAESCTGGLIAAAITDRPGSSAVFDCGLITYSNKSKTRLLGVSADLLAVHGAVSEACAAAMVGGVLTRSTADLALAVTGLAGPDGGAPNNPVGLVYIACARPGHDPVIKRFIFNDYGDRASIRAAARDEAISLALQVATEAAPPVP